jgi:hypothetical protein
VIFYFYPRKGIDDDWKKARDDEWKKPRDDEWKKKSDEFLQKLNAGPVLPPPVSRAESLLVLY